jgi:uncharacterized protein (TIGR03067 family)
MGCGVLLVLSILPAGSEPDPAGDEMKKFQRKRVCVYVEKEGQPVPKEGLDDLLDIEILVEGNRITLKEAGRGKEGWSITYKVDPTKAPRTIDISMSIDDATPKTSLGIYKLEGGILKISIIEPKKEPERPTEFITKPGASSLLWQLKRK